MALPQEQMVGVLCFHGWGRSRGNRPYLVFSINGERVEWFFFGQLDAELIGQEVVAHVAVGNDRRFLNWAEPLHADAGGMSASVRELQAMWDVSHE